MKRSTWVIAIGVSALLGLALMACTSFDIGDVIRVRTPPRIQQQTGLGSKLTLNDAEREYRAWLDDVQREGVAWRSNIENANDLASLFNDLTLSFLDQASAFPAAAPFIPGASLLLGVFMGRGRLNKEKQASFNKGQREATSILGSVVSNGGNGSSSTT